MENLKLTPSFVDADGHRAFITVEISHRNGYPELAMMADYCDHGGQCLDLIKPNTAYQEELIKIWKTHHLQDISAYPELPARITKLVNQITVDDRDYCIKAIEAQELADASDDDKLLAEMKEYDISSDLLDACRTYKEAGISSNLKNFSEAYEGKWQDDEDFANDMADNMGIEIDNMRWPHNCIDWELAASELMRDYTEQDGYYFRNL